MSPPFFTRSSAVEQIGGWPPALFDPAGPFAGSITVLNWAMLGLFVLVTGIVLAALWAALFGSMRLRKRLGGTAIIWIGGVIFPVVVLTMLLVWGLRLTSNLSNPPRPGEMRMRVTGEMWWWRVVYLDRQGRPAMFDANELHIPTGEAVTVELRSADVVHSFWVPRLSGKLDMVPGRSNVIRIQADKPGVYGGQCAEYCGGPHALMGFVVVAHAPADFARWLDWRRAQQQTATARVGESRGLDLFLSSGCGACHRIAGTPANGLAGPDLTHVGSRRTLGAGILPNNRGTMMGWIADSQAIKPGNRMPSYSMLSGDELRALAIYLENRK